MYCLDKNTAIINPIHTQRIQKDTIAYPKRYDPHLRGFVFVKENYYIYTFIKLKLNLL